MYHPTRPVRRARTAAAIITVTAVMVGGAACGTENAKDGQPSAPAQQLQRPFASHPATSADSAERRGLQDQQDRRHKWVYSAGDGHPILLRR